MKISICFVIFCLLFLFGCGSKSNSDIISISEDYELCLDQNLSSDQVARSQITSAAEYTIKAWIHNNGRLPHTLFIISKNHPTFQDQELNGAWYGASVVTLWAGDHNELPALYHECAHRTFLLYDHSDVRWPQWDHDGNEIYHQIAAAR